MCNAKRTGRYNRINFQAGVKELAEKWQLGGTVGDQVNFSGSVNSVFQQDWLTLLSFEKPGLINILPCEFNRCRFANVFQLHLYLSNAREEHRPGECHGDTVEEWEVRDAAYHHCPGIIRLQSLSEESQASSGLQSTLVLTTKHWGVKATVHIMFCSVIILTLVLLIRFSFLLTSIIIIVQSSPM